MGIAETLQSVRKKAGLSAEDVSARLDGVISRSVIANIENGRKSDITIGELVQLSRALNVSPLDLAPELEDFLSTKEIQDRARRRIIRELEKGLG